MTETKYKFLPSMTPGLYAVFHRETDTRVPGIVSPGTHEGKRRLTYDRELPPEKKGGRHKHISFTAASVAEMSEKVERYFATGEVPT